MLYLARWFHLKYSCKHAHAHCSNPAIENLAVDTQQDRRKSLSSLIQYHFEFIACIIIELIHTHGHMDKVVDYIHSDCQATTLPTNKSSPPNSLKVAYFERVRVSDDWHVPGNGNIRISSKCFCPTNVSDEFSGVRKRNILYWSRASNLPGSRSLHRLIPFEVSWKTASVSIGLFY